MRLMWGAALAAAVAAVLGGCTEGCPVEQIEVSIGGDFAGEGEPSYTSLSPICAWQAHTEEQRRAGLTAFEPLGEEEGLVIHFPVEDEICIVNRGVPYAIDVIYTNTDEEVVAVERNVPAGDETLRCHGGTRMVVEVPAGVARLVEPGESVWPPVCLRTTRCWH